jgi:hypothetical protein
MVMNRLQKGLINFRIVVRASRLNCKKKNLMGTHIFFFLVILIEIQKNSVCLKPHDRHFKNRKKRYCAIPYVSIRSRPGVHPESTRSPSGKHPAPTGNPPGAHLENNFAISAKFTDVYCNCKQQLSQNKW